jgi:hypothetical protein
MLFRTLYVTLVLGCAATLGLLAGSLVASAHHDQTVCGGSLRGELTWAIDPQLDPAPWQLAQRTINLNPYTPPRQYLSAVPWGSWAHIYIVASPIDLTWVQPFCATGQTVIWVDVGDSTSYLTSIAPHEFLHAWRLADHIYSWLDPSRYYSPLPCDGPSAHPYAGRMSYCAGMQWGPDDADLLERIW